MALNPNRTRGIVSYGHRAEPGFGPEDATRTILLYGGGHPEFRQHAIEGQHLEQTGFSFGSPEVDERMRIHEKQILAATRNYYTQSVGQVPAMDYGWKDYRSFAMTEPLTMQEAEQRVAAQRPLADAQREAEAQRRAMRRSRKRKIS